jgi:hypothetical protein
MITCIFFNVELLKFKYSSLDQEQNEYKKIMLTVQTMYHLVLFPEELNIIKYKITVFFSV